MSRGNPECACDKTAEGKPKAGVVFTLLKLYRETDADMPGRFARMWRGIVEEALSGSVELHFPSVAVGADEVAAAVASCEKADCDLLLILPMAYAPSGAARDALCAVKLPLLLVSTARDATLPYDMSTDHIMANHAMHGIQDLANVLARAGRAFEVVAGHFSDSAFRDRLVCCARAAAGARILQAGRVGRIGEPFKGMLDFSFDPKALAEKLGFETVELSPADLAQFAENVSPQRVDELYNWAKQEFDIDAGLTEKVFAISARWGLGLEDAVQTHELDAVTMNFVALSAAGAGTMPFLGASRLMARGIGYAGESDVLTAALVAALARAVGDVTFTEMFCPDYERSEVLLSHMGECNYALANPRKPVRLIAKEFAFGECAAPAVPVFQLRPGTVTLASLTEWPGEGSRLVVTRCEVVDAPEHPNLDSPHARLNMGRDLGGFLEDYSRAGGTHHLALAYGDVREDLAVLTRLLGIGFVDV